MKKKALACDPSRALMGFFYQHTQSDSKSVVLNVRVQDRIAEEIYSVSPDPEAYVGMNLRKALPFTRATLLEDFRYHSMVPTPGPKCITCATEICGVVIPEDTELLVNFWSIHHDKELWGDLEVFQPERFLDANGDLVPPDNPLRRYVMPSTGGIRNCPGEQLAVSRLFLFLANTCKRFQIFPGKDNNPDMVSLAALINRFIMYPPRFKFIFKKRAIPL